jgi:hypothetical protein
MAEMLSNLIPHRKKKWAGLLPEGNVGLLVRFWAKLMLVLHTYLPLYPRTDLGSPAVLMIPVEFPLVMICQPLPANHPVSKPSVNSLIGFPSPWEPGL